MHFEQKTLVDKRREKNKSGLPMLMCCDMSAICIVEERSNLEAWKKNNDKRDRDKTLTHTK